MDSTSQSYDQIVSLGYRCSSAGIIKSLGLKTESYPFDWLVSRLPIIEHCIHTEFKEFLNPDNYKTKSGVTNHYVSTDPSSRQWICNESICFNEYYESAENPQTQYYLPQPLTSEHDAYGYKLMMNHRNIKTPQDQTYYSRCIERWYSASHRRLVFYIHPAVFYDEFLQIRPKLIEELRRAHKSINPFGDGIYIIPVRTPFEYPTNHCAKYVLEEQPDDESSQGCRICILWANREFIDAGEIFMGNCHAETYVIKDYLQQTVNNRGLLPNSSSN
jgi:hypothetical protein